MQRTAGNIPPFLSVFADIPGIISLQSRIELFRIPHNNDIPFFQIACRYRYRRDTYHIDTHTIDIGMLTLAMYRHHLFSRQHLTHTDRFVITGFYIKMDPISFSDNIRLHPCRIIIAYGIPAFYGRFAVGIITLAVKKTSGSYRTVFIHLPGVFIRHHHLPASILVGNNQAGQKGFIVSKEIIIRHSKSHIAGIPTRIQTRCNAIIPVGQQLGHVVCIISQHFTILAISRSKPIFAHPFPVHK